MAISVVMPALEMAQETGKLVSWLKKEGEQVKKGEMLLEVETDKAVVEIEAAGDGVLGGRHRQGRRRRSGRPDDRLAGEAGRSRSAAGGAARRSGRKMDAAPAAAAAAPAPAAAEPASAAGARISPKARSLRASTASTSAKLKGSGPGGEILADDILKRAAQAERSRRGAALRRHVRLALRVAG